MSNKIIMFGCCIFTLLTLAAIAIWIGYVGDFGYGIGLLIIYPIGRLVEKSLSRKVEQQEVL